MMMVLEIALGTLVLTYLLTGVVRGYALRRGVLDVPNARSSHSEVMPRGGGLALALIILPGIVVLGFLHLVPLRVALALFGGGVAVATIGWLDDCRRLSACLRAAVHALAAGWAVGWLGGFTALDYGVGTLSLGWLGSLLAFLGIIWMINLYNFMDGIDGIAGGEAVVVTTAAGMLLLAEGQAGLASLSFLVAGSVTGFLAWNWPPAKIFMGDVGSGLLGFLLAALTICSEKMDALPALIWVLLLAVFIIDATVTLLYRIAKGERWYQAHRSHAYQLAVQMGFSHKQVTSAVVVLDLLLAVSALLAWKKPPLLMPVLGIAVLGLTILWWYLRVTSSRRGMDAANASGVGLGC